MKCFEIKLKKTVILKRKRRHEPDHDQIPNCFESWIAYKYLNDL